MIKLQQLLEQKDSNDAAGIAYIVNDEMLCVQDNNGEWGIPKGHIREGETPEEGAYREFTEETQIILNKEIIFSHKVPKNKKGIFHVFYCLGDIKITPHIGHEHINSGYYNITDLPQPFSEKVIKVVDNINEVSKTSGIKGLKGATGFIKPEEWEEVEKFIFKNIFSS